MFAPTDPYNHSRVVPASRRGPPDRSLIKTRIYPIPIRLTPDSKPYSNPMKNPIPDENLNKTQWTQHLLKPRLESTLKTQPKPYYNPIEKPNNTLFKTLLEPH